MLQLDQRIAKFHHFSFRQNVVIDQLIVMFIAPSFQQNLQYAAHTSVVRTVHRESASSLGFSRVIAL
jgi:hypothetical protein